MKSEHPIKEKNLAIAIGLNVLFPGIGYMYMGKVIAGFAAIFIFLTIGVLGDTLTISASYLTINLLMVIDMIILHNKRNKALVEQEFKKCPYCAELVKQEAMVCRYCGAQLLQHNK